VPLSYQLKSGDQVEILTSKKQHPQPEWDKYVVTAHAKSKLREWFKKETKTIATAGKRTLAETFANQNVELNDAVLMRLLNHFNISDRQNLYYQIGKNVLDLSDIRKILQPKNKKGIKNLFGILGGLHNEKEILKLPAHPVTNEKIDRKKTFILTDDQKDYELAECCHPIPGDDVLGYVDEDEIVMVHKVQCPVAAKLKASQGERIISVKWDMRNLTWFPETIEIKGIDKKGILVDILKVISVTHDMNMSKTVMESNDGIFIGKFHILVHNTQEIEAVRKDLLKIKGVNFVGRV
jgi:GTP pyrophosphokinase